MSALVACQLLIDPPSGGAWNMAVDEVLLAATAISGQPTLRLYQWQRPTLSLGYFQKAADRSRHPPSFGIDVVRRLSGGGAIVHDQELTYSFFLPASHNLSHDTQALYEAVHQAILETLCSFLTPAASSWQAALCDQPARLAARDEPFLCFQRRAGGDILLRKKESPLCVSSHKIVGSAQRRRQGVVLQHGSILLGRSQLAPELAGFSEITQSKISRSDFLARLTNQLAKNLALDLTKSSLPEDLAVQTCEIQREKYQSADWTERR